MIKKRACFIGQPNVGKSSLFNILTKMHQHTGNWTGKTVDLTYGTVQNEDILWEVVDLPGTYSLIGESEEEKITASYVYEKQYDVAVVVLDATNLERGFALLLQVLEIAPQVVVCLNLYDEAKKIDLDIDIARLNEIFQVPIIATSAKNNMGIKEFLEHLNHPKKTVPYPVSMTPKIEKYLEFMMPYLKKEENPKATAINLLYEDKYMEKIKKSDQDKVKHQLSFFRHYIKKSELLESYLLEAKKISLQTVHRQSQKPNQWNEFLDQALTNKWSGIPIMILLLFLVLWITIIFSNIPSSWLFSLFQYLEPKLYALLSFLPSFLLDPLVLGGYRTLYWVVSVMLPPMAIFFPLFSLLEDYGLLPRIAFNLDRPFKKCGSCGKQSLTMCMGLGCNAVGVTGTRIMESKKMRILSILTNVFMPCNGRFPAMISMISMFFVLSTNRFSSIISSLFLTGIILFGIALTFFLTKICNHFLFKNEKTVFVLELPAYRAPKVFKTIYHALKDKALDVLLRAMKVAFPAGLLIFFLANIQIGQATILSWLQELLNPFGLLIGLDGVILLSFLLGLPANEIVIPIMLLCYNSGSALMEYESLESLKLILLNHHWTTLTALNFLILCLCHFPCATTLLTIKEETKSRAYTILAFFLPTIIGLILCFLTTLIWP